MTLLLTLVLGLVAHAGEDTAMKGKAAQELYQAINSVNPVACKNRKCDAELKDLSCRWVNGRKMTGGDCSFTKNGKSHEVSGRKALRLANAVMNSNLVETDCGMSHCGFQANQDVGCSENVVGRKKPSYICSVAEHSDSCLPEADRGELALLKAKYNAARSKNPGCVSGRGAAACLSARDMMTMAKLESKEEKGCRSSEDAGRYGRDQKPTMEAN